MKKIIAGILIVWLAASCSGGSANHTKVEDSSTLNTLKDPADNTTANPDSVPGVANGAASSISGSTGAAGAGSGVTSPGSIDSSASQAGKKEQDSSRHK